MGAAQHLSALAYNGQRMKLMAQNTVSILPYTKDLTRLLGLRPVPYTPRADPIDLWIRDWP